MPKVKNVKRVKKVEKTENSALKVWVNATRSITDYMNGSVEIYLDNTYTKIKNVPGLKTALFPHQQVQTHWFYAWWLFRPFRPRH